jgi:hypothetical protein
VSSIPIFALCYTLILSRIEGKGETLEEKATRLEQGRQAKERIRATQQGWFTGMVKAAISAAADVATHTQQTIEASRSQHSQDTEQENNTPVVTWNEQGKVNSVQFPGKAPVYRSAQNGHSNDTVTDVQQIQNGHSNDAATDRVMDVHAILNGHSNGHSADTGMDVHATNSRYSNGHSRDTATDVQQIEQVSQPGHSRDTVADTEMDIEPIDQGYTDIAQARATGRVYLHLEDASKMYGYSVSYLAKLIQSGKIRTHRSDKTRVLESSLRAYTVKNGRKTLELPIVQSARNVDRDTGELPAFTLVLPKGESEQTEEETGA